MDNIFWYTLVLIFLSAIIGSFMNSRSKDRCLNDFRGFNVTMHEIDGDVIWGALNVYCTGIELFYLDPHFDPDGYIESSYILYKDQYPTIQGIYRYHDALSPRNQKIREKSIKKTYHPKVFRRLLRQLRNIVNTFKDSIYQSIGLIIGQAQKANPKSTLLKTQDKRLTSITQDIVQVTANAYEPILERYIGKRVVMDVHKEGEEYEFHGILKEYTNEFIEILDITRREQVAIQLPADDTATFEQFNLIVNKSGFKVTLENKSAQSILIRQLVVDNSLREINLTCEPRAAKELDLPEKIEENAEIVIEMVRIFDAIIHRKFCLVRHCGEPLDLKVAK
ncbi:hypothetical protein JXJ21_07265 [candidate division KSB1 bacterium]|nr:hypothetical protein [candidate division KSB1 bacterium]